MLQPLGLDIGRKNVKIVTGTKMIYFPSCVGEWRERKLVTQYEDSMEVEFRGRRFFVGTLAENESEFARYMMTDEKDHEDALILALAALHRAEIEEAVVVTGLPVASHKEPKKQAMKQLLTGRHDFTLNGMRRPIHIPRVEVAVEGGGAFWSFPRDGLVRLVDGGSKTINAVTMRNKRYVDRDSWTLVNKDGNTYGFETGLNADPEQLINQIAADLGRRWGREDEVWTNGGEAELIAKLLKPFFPRANPLPGPLFANAVGFFNVARTLV